jgi:hypothetical protein
MPARANKEWLGDGAWLRERIVGRRGGAGVIPTISGQCANTKFIVKGASPLIRSDDADAKYAPSFVYARPLSSRPLVNPAVLMFVRVSKVVAE